MADDPSGARRSDYRAARIGAAGALTATLAMLLLADVIPPLQYEIQPAVLGTLGMMIATLLGVELASIRRDRQ